MIDTVSLAVSELVTNAVKHGRPPVGLTLRRLGASVRVDIHDDNPVEPNLSPVQADDTATGGRGLAIVAALSDNVGCEQVPNDGKVVYAEFSEPEAGRRRPGAREPGPGASGTC